MEEVVGGVEGEGAVFVDEWAEVWVFLKVFDGLLAHWASWMGSMLMNYGVEVLRDMRRITCYVWLGPLG